MKNEKLLSAMGKISDELIEAAAIKNTNALPRSRVEAKRSPMPARRRMFRVGIAVALLACLLGTAAFASRSWEFSSYNPQIIDTEEVFTPTKNGYSASGVKYELSFYLPLNENAPDIIDTFYFPKVPDIYKQSFGYAYAGLNRDKLVSIYYAWDVPDGAKHGIRFLQESGFESNELETVAYGTSDCAPVMKEVALGGVEGVLIVETAEEAFNPGQHFFWSNGDYVFEMRFPLEFTEEQMAEIIGSVEEVEDVQQHLISMTEDDKKATFG